MTAADVLAAHGILRAPEVVELAAAARLDLACAAVLLVKESGGGRNVWGSDPVPTAGSYDTGGVVTRDNYLAYRAAVRRGDAGRQGVGPCQLTFGGFQDEADRLGGCWRWDVNCRVGFSILASLISRYGERAGFGRYNGSGAAADRYAADAMTKLKQWRVWLAGTENTVTDTPTCTAEPCKAEPPAGVWQASVRNAFGDVVSALQVLNGIEQRLADIQAQLDGKDCARVE